jgi:MFS family permease
MLAPFATPGFGGLWISASSGSFARVVTQLAFSWITLEATGSPFLVGVVAAARMAPQLLLGIPAGALADWFERRMLIVAANAAGIVLLTALTGLAAAGLLSPAVLVIASALYGVLDTVRTAATQAHAYDLVRTSRATSGMALTNLGTQLLGTVGGLAGGYALERFGGAATFGLVALALLVASLSPLIGARPAATTESARSAPVREAWPDFGHAATLLTRNRLLAVLAVCIILAEIFGFAGQTLLPIFARDVFDVGASGLGIMMAVRSGGGALGLLLLTRLGPEGRSGLLFVTAAGMFGLALLLFASSPVYALALVFLALSGSCASVMDTLGQTLMQRNAAEQERGAAMGLWVFSVGFGPVGHLTLGAAATAFGAPLAQTVSGMLLTIMAAVAALHAPLRRSR